MSSDTPPSRSKKDYQKGKIYIIRNNINDLTYIGSTCQELSQRMAEHRKNINSKRCNHFKLYQEMNNIGKNNFYIELLENCPCNSKAELFKREGECIRTLKSQLNSRVSGRTPQQYEIDNREERNKKHQERYETNKERILEINRRSYEKHKDKYNERKKEYYYETYPFIKEERNRKAREKYKEKKEKEKERSITD